MQSVSACVFLNATGSVCPFPWGVFGVEYVCLSYGLLKTPKSAKLGRKSMRPLLKKLQNPYFQKNVTKFLTIGDVKYNLRRVVNILFGMNSCLC